MAIYDITRELSGDVPVYPGDIVPEINQIDFGQYRVTDLHIGSHSGTHIDAPSHYIHTGNTVDQIPVERLTGPVQVIDLSGVKGAIDAAHLKGRLSGVKKILLKTSFSGEDIFSPDFPHLSPDAADFLLLNGIDCVGIDSPSIEVFNGDGTVHRKLLGNNVVIIELLDLSPVPEGEYYMVALPLRLKGLDGSPARVVLSDRNFPME